MTADVRSVESRLRDLEDTVAELRQRLRAVEAAGPGIARSEAFVTPPGVPADAPGVDAAGPLDVATFLPLVGRTFMVIGGAFLLRAMTDTGRLPVGPGVAIAMLYALGWLVAALRVRDDQRLSGVFHGVAAVIIGVPLIVEASTRFSLVTPWASACGLAAFSGLALFVSWRRDLQTPAAVATLATLGAAIYLASATSAYLPCSVVLVAVGVATLWLGYDRDWFWMRWVTALVADIAMIGLTTRAVSPQHAEAALPVIVVQLGLVGLYLGSFAARTLWKGRVLVPFEVAQTVAALAVGLGGALVVARASGSGVTGLGAGTLAFGAGAYAVAFAFVSRRQGLGANFYFYATLALLLTCVGTTVLASGAPMVFCVALGGLAVATTWLGRRFSRHALAYHGVVYCLMSAAASGLLSTSLAVMAGRASALWPSVAPAAWVALLAAVACVAIPRLSADANSTTAGTLPRVVMLIVAVSGAAGAAMLAVGPPLAGTPPEPGLLATLRTVLLAVSAVALAACGRTERLAEARWLVYPVLALAAVKLLVEDMRLSQPATLFLALALLGAALVLSPRLLRHAGAPRAGGVAPAA